MDASQEFCKIADSDAALNNKIPLVAMKPTARSSDYLSTHEYRKQIRIIKGRDQSRVCHRYWLTTCRHTRCVYAKITRCFVHKRIDSIAYPISFANKNKKQKNERKRNNVNVKFQ